MIFGSARGVLGFVGIVAFVVRSAPAFATDFPVSPGVTQAQVNALMAQLMPGDTLTVAPGEYPGIELDVQRSGGAAIAGTASQPIVLRGTPDATGALPHLTAHTDGFQEAVRLHTGTAFVIVERLHLSATGSTTQAGIYVDPGVHDIIVRDCEISDVTGIGIQIQTQNDVHHFVIERTHIHDTGTNTADGNNGGQAFTAGGFDAAHATTGVHDLVLRQNLVHDTRGQEGDCAKFMYGVFASTMEDNVFYDCPRGVAQAENYGITSYGSGRDHFQIAADDNVLRRNLLLDTAGTNAGERNVAIYVGPGTVVENNVVVHSNAGIAARLEDEAPQMRNLRVVNNTVYGATDNAFSMRGCQQADASVVVANNALFAVDPAGFGYRLPDPTGSAVIRANLFAGQDYAEASAPAVIAVTATPDAVFAHPSLDGTVADFMPHTGSPLIDKGFADAAPGNDFDLAMRPVGSAADVGAYEWRSDLNAHWALAHAFKATSAAGTGGDGGLIMTPHGTGGCGCGVAGRARGRWLAGAWVIAALAITRRRRAALR